VQNFAYPTLLFQSYKTHHPEEFCFGDTISLLAFFLFFSSLTWRENEQKSAHKIINADYFKKLQEFIIITNYFFKTLSIL